MFEAKHRHNLFGFFLNTVYCVKGTHIYFKKTQVCENQLPTIFHKHADACSGE
jgi:hypothetical protein